MDDIILQCTKENIEQNKNRFFVKGDPGAMLMIEFACETEAELRQKATALGKELRAARLGYHYPLITGDENIKLSLIHIWAWQ